MFTTLRELGLSVAIYGLAVYRAAIDCITAHSFNARASLKALVGSKWNFDCFFRCHVRCVGSFEAKLRGQVSWLMLRQCCAAGMRGSAKPANSCVLASGGPF